MDLHARLPCCFLTLMNAAKLFGQFSPDGLASTLLGPKNLSFKGRWELGVVEQSSYHDITRSTFV